MTTDIIRKILPHALEHVAGLLLSVLKIGTHPLPQPIQRTMFVVFALLLLIFLRYFFVMPFMMRALAINSCLGRNVVHRRAGEHPLGPGDVSAVRADVNS